MKIGVIGYGNMGSMIVNNILNLNLLLKDEELLISNRNPEKIAELKNIYPESKLIICPNNKELAKQSEKILICVETPQFKEIIEEILPFINKNTHIIHTCAGLNFKHINTFYKGQLSLIIPTIASTTLNNVPLTSPLRRKGISLIQHNEKVDEENKNYIESLFEEFSYVKVLDNENKKDNIPRNNDLNLETATILTSCGPAFIALLIQKIAKIANENSNLTYEETEEMITKTIAGTSFLKDNDNISTEDIMNKVATKKGITQEGIDYLDSKIEEISNELIKTLLNRYKEVKSDMDQEYL